MPVRVWVLSTLMLGIVAVAVGVLLFARPEDPPENSVDVANTDPAPAAIVAAEAAPDVLPTPQPAGASAPAVDGMVRIEVPFEMPFEIAAAPPPDEALRAELAAYADHRRVDLPLHEGGATLETVEIDGRMIVFNYRVDIDLRLRTLPADPTPLLPGLQGWLCYSVCFEFEDEFVEEACRSDVFPLLEHGAVAVYKYRDMNLLPIGTLPVSVQDCPPDTTPMR